MPTPTNLIPFPGGAEDQTETQLRTRLYEWGDDVLRELPPPPGLAARISQANTQAELHRVVFDENVAEVELAIREALHPASGGTKAKHFAFLDKKGLKRVLKARFSEMKRVRMNQLRNGAGSGGNATGQSARWSDDLKFDDKGNIRPFVHNLIVFLCGDPQWNGVLGYDEFKARVVVRKPPPWPPNASWTDTVWTDHHEVLTRRWFQEHQDINPVLGDVGRAVQTAARANVFHTVREYLNALVWDETPRLDTWLMKHFHADDTAYIRAVGPRFLISAVARIYKPGCQVDHMLILEGPQGEQKSKALRVLTVRDDWFSDRISNVHTKDSILETAGVWLFEMAEMDAQARASASAMKAFITRRYDNFVPRWGKHPIKLPRQCVFTGTINPPVGGYLKDPTGARRFWPVECHGMIDVEALERSRDQLWAEAVAQYHAGKKWWLETPELEALATAEQRLRFKSDVWREPVKRWLGRRKDVSLSEVMKGALRIALLDQDQRAQNRVVDILTELGFTKYRARNGDRRPSRYRRP